MVSSDTALSRVVANVAIWTILLFGLFHVVVFGDWSIGIEVAILAIGKSSWS